MSQHLKSLASEDGINSIQRDENDIEDCIEVVQL